MKKLFIVVLLLFTPLAVYSQPQKKHIYYEKEYQKHWCNCHSGEAEVMLADKTRVDCCTATHAIEFDFASKWAESIGQALYYAHILNKCPGIVLIVEDKIRDARYLSRIIPIAKKCGITLWLMYPEDMIN